MLFHLLVLLFNRHSMQSMCAVFHFKWYVLLLYLTYHPFFEAGYSVSPNIKAWRTALVYTVANIWQFEHKNSKWSTRFAFGNRDLVYQNCRIEI